MVDSDNKNQDSVIEKALKKFADVYLRGQQPDTEEFVRQYPDCEDLLRQRIQNLLKINTLFDTLVQMDESDFGATATGHDLVGRKIGGFEIREIIGRGGMGVVYIARDTKLDRLVAVKSIPPEFQKNATTQARFKREAKLLASLNHPNIAVIHEIIEQDDGADYLILEYVPGETLAERLAREPFKLQEALSISQQIAEAVSAAHEKGVVHRDLKPGNVKIMPDGRVKVLDFGLAKATASEGKPVETTVTLPGRIMGTPAYMSPEQARGKDTDRRTDIWSFGCIMYQMLTGRLPFEGETATDTLARIIERQPDWDMLPQDTPMNIRVLLRRCLEKNLQQRLRDIGDAAIEIKETLTLPATVTATAIRPAAQVRSRWRWAIAIGFVVVAIVVGLNIGRRREQLPADAGPGHIKSLAVLPLDNLSGDPNQEYFSDGMTEALITELSKISALRVIARQSVMQYKESEKSLPEIARELDVDAVVEGSVLRVAERVRITAQLIGTVPERHLWADNYDRDFGDALILSSEVAQSIAREIQVTLTPGEQALLTSAHPVNPEAHDLYMKGKYHYFKFNKEQLEKANDYFQQAIDVDPNYAQAYAGLAASYEFLAWAGYMSRDEAKSKTMALLSRALEIDNTLAEVHLALAGVRIVLFRDRIGGEKEIKLALALNPNLAEAHYENAFYLMSAGRFAESIASAKQAQQLDPLSYKYLLAYMYTYARQYDQAIAQHQYLAELEPKKTTAYNYLANVYEQMGRYEDAVEARQKAMALSEIFSEEIEELGRVYSKDGPKGYWMWRLEKLKSWDEPRSYLVAQIYAQLGDKEQAFVWLEKACENNDRGLYRLKVEPLLDPLRDDPRFGEMLRRMNIPE